MAPEQGLATKDPIIKNEEGSNPEKAIYGVKARLLLGTEPASAENGVLQKLIRAPRYFNPPECSWPTCNAYVEIYDEGKKDKPKRKCKRCYICGNISHRGKRCKKVNACFICSKNGHLAIDCPNKNVETDWTSTSCLKCGNTGHNMFSCTNEYDSEDLKVTECYICKQIGHLCCVDKKTEGPREVSCYNCGQSGHFGQGCTKSNEVPNDLRPLCRECREMVHSKSQCAKAKSGKEDGAATKAGKRKSRKARGGKNTKQTSVNNASQIQPYGLWWPPIGDASKIQPKGVWWPPNVGPYYGRPGSYVWSSPAAAAERSSLSHQAGALPSRQQTQP